MAMSVPARDFIFSVDTAEVATTMAPPAPVIAQPRRRAAAPTVALRLPHLAAAAEPAPAPTAPLTFSPWAPPDFQLPPAATVSLPSEIPAPLMTFPKMPAVEPVAPTVVYEAPTPTPTPTPAASEPIVAAVATTVVESPLVATEEEPYWKNPKFMLAGVAATFLGMVSLMAMKHQPEKPMDEAPAWESAQTAKPTAAETEAMLLPEPAAPIVVHGAVDRNQEVRQQELQPEYVPTAVAAQYEAPQSSVTDRFSRPDQSGYGQGAQRSAWTPPANEPLPEDTDGAAVLLPNLADPAAREANTDLPYGGSTR
jgi:hypothetical protein